MHDKRMAELSVSYRSLETRLDINQRRSSRDFHAWVQRILNVAPGMDVLDVGCGTGAQTLAMLAAAGARGSVSALDISAESIAHLLEASLRPANLEALVGDMQLTGELVRSRFRVKRYDLAQSTYALYYAARPLEILDAMRGALKCAGRLAVCTPSDPHSLSLLCGRFLTLPPKVVECGRFGPEVLEPYFRRHFHEVDIHLLRNVMTFPTAGEVLQLLRNAAYFDPAIEAQVTAAIEVEIARSGHFLAEKNSYMIVGHAD